MATRKSSTTIRTLHYFWGVTKIQLPMFVLDVAVTLGYVFFLTFASPLIVGRIVDMVGGGRLSEARMSCRSLAPTSQRSSP